MCPTRGGALQYPSLSDGSSGEVDLVWQDDRDGNFEIYGQSIDHEDTAARLSQTAGASYSPQVSIDPSGIYHLVWIEDRSGVAQVYYKTLKAGAWSLDGRVSGSPVSVGSAHIVAGAYENTAIIWQDERDGSYELYSLIHESDALSDAASLDPSRLTTISFAPNPFSDNGEFVLDLPSEQRVRIQVFDLSGRRVCLLQDAVLSAGSHRVGWNARDDQGGHVGSGVYFYRLETGGITKTGRVVRIQ
jgi:hypothetical protein